jgi:hypothetical protein
MRQFGELEAVIMDRLWAWGRPALVREVPSSSGDVSLFTRRPGAAIELTRQLDRHLGTPPGV